MFTERCLPGLWLQAKRQQQVEQRQALKTLMRQAVAAAEAQEALQQQQQGTGTGQGSSSSSRAPMPVGVEP